MLPVHEEAAVARLNRLRHEVAVPLDRKPLGLEFCVEVTLHRLGHANEEIGNDSADTGRKDGPEKVCRLKVKTRYEEPLDHHLHIFPLKERSWPALARVAVW